MRPIDADELFINLDGMMAVSPTGYIHGDTVADMISDAPTVDAVPVRHGHWIEHEWAEESEGLLIPNYECSECHWWARNESDYCPHCGAKMKPCDDCQEFDCYGCEYAERREENGK